MRKTASTLPRPSLLGAAPHVAPEGGGAQLEPRQGWVLLAHGETVGHGAPRHKRRTLLALLTRYQTDLPFTAHCAH